MPNQSITLNHTEYPINATRRKGCRRFVIRWDAKNQQVKLSLPMRASLKDALVFTHTKKVWLELQQEKRQEVQRIEPNVIIPILGNYVLLRHEEGRGLATYALAETGGDYDATLTIHGDSAFFNRRLKDWLNKHLKATIHPIAEEKATLLGVSFSRIQIRDVSRQWGSCSASGTLSFSTKLVFANLEQLNYIICHEVAHLREMNHSPKFWKLVAELCPDYAKQRQWFKTHGSELNKYHADL